MENRELHIVNKKAIRTMLEAGARLTVKSVWRVIKTTELRHYLSQLRRDGLIIKDEWLHIDGKRFKQYWLAAE